MFIMVNILIFELFCQVEVLEPELAGILPNLRVLMSGKKI